MNWSKVWQSCSCIHSEKWLEIINDFLLRQCFAKYTTENKGPKNCSAVLYYVYYDSSCCTTTRSRAGGSGCAGYAAAHPIFGSFVTRDLSFELNKLDFYTNLHTQCLEASTGPDLRSAQRIVHLSYWKIPYLLVERSWLLCQMRWKAWEIFWKN